MINAGAVANNHAASLKPQAFSTIWSAQRQARSLLTTRRVRPGGRKRRRNKGTVWVSLALPPSFCAHSGRPGGQRSSASGVRWGAPGLRTHTCGSHTPSPSQGPLLRLTRNVVASPGASRPLRAERGQARAPSSVSTKGTLSSARWPGHAGAALLLAAPSQPPLRTSVTTGALRPGFGRHRVELLSSSVGDGHLGRWRDRCLTVGPGGPRPRSSRALPPALGRAGGLAS